MHKHHQLESHPLHRIYAMKIAFLNPVGTLGGAERALLDFVASLRQVEPTLEMHLIAGSDGPFLREAESLGVRCEALDLPPHLAEFGDSTFSIDTGTRIGKAFQLAYRGMLAWREARRYASHLKKRLQEIMPDIVHSNGIKFHLLSTRAALPGVPIVWHIHDFVSTRRLVSRALRWSASQASHAIANSRAVEADFRALIPSMLATTIYNGIDTEIFSPGPGNGERLDQLAGMTCGGSEMLRVGLVATYARWKGQDTFLQAAAKTPESVDGTPIRYFIIGGPIYQTRGSQTTEAELRGFAAQLGIAHRVGFIPFQSDVASVYRSLDVVVHASTRPEPFGLTIVQAMACGRPVIAMQAGGAAELFTDDVDAIGAPPNDPNSLAVAIGKLTANQGLRVRLGETARKHAVARFARMRLGPELLAVYQRVRSFRS
jgi:glycosyltransferase involved in cell wall biosynthesis